jgi:hypothetical protein
LEQTDERQQMMRPQAEWEQEIAELRASAGMAVDRWRRSEAIRKAAIDQAITQGETIAALERQLAELSQLVGVETPIAAFTLAQTWYAEKAAYQEEIAALHAALIRWHRADGRTDFADADQDLADIAAALAAREGAT